MSNEELKELGIITEEDDNYTLPEDDKDLDLYELFTQGQ